MIPLHVLRETPFILSLEMEAREKALVEGRQEGRQETREVVIGMLLHSIGKRFPTLDIGTEIKRVHDLEALKQLFFDLDRISDEESLRRRLAALSPTSQD